MAELRLKPPDLPPNIPDTITYLERELRGESVGHSRKMREVEELYLFPSEICHHLLKTVVKAWGDSPGVRQILFYHYLQREPIIKEIILHCIYPGFKQGRYLWKESELRFFLSHLGLERSEQSRTIKYLERAMMEIKILVQAREGRYIDYQRPSIEAVAYAFYAEYGDGFSEARSFSLKNPPLEQILHNAAFPAFLFIDPRRVLLILETCRLKNYITLESRGGLNQYALIYQDLIGLVDYMSGGGAE